VTTATLNQRTAQLADRGPGEVDADRGAGAGDTAVSMARLLLEIMAPMLFATAVLCVALLCCVFISMICREATRALWCWLRRGG
jgi:hypothetical protein